MRVLTARPKLDENSRVLVIGDSFMQGMAPHFKTLANEAEIPLLAMAEKGSRVDQWSNRPELAAALIDFDPTHVLVSLGGNDHYTNFTPEQVAERAQQLVDLIEETDAHVIWIGAPDMPPTRGELTANDDILDAIKEITPNYYDSTMLEIPRGPDGLHPLASGYAGWAGDIWNWLT